MSWSPDGWFLAYENRAGGSYDLWVLPLSGDREPYAFLATQFNEAHPQFSPDGRWLGYTSNETGRYEVYIRGFDQAEGGKWQISTDGAVQPRWKGDGSELYYLAADGKIMAVPMDAASSTPGAGIPEPLFQTQSQGTSSIVHFAVTSDGGRFLMPAPPDSEQSMPITVVLNWQAELGR